MDNRSRFRNVMAFQPVDAVPNYEVGVWPQTAELWKQAGLPDHALGGAGDPTGATKEFGAKIFDSIVAALVDVIEEFYETQVKLAKRKCSSWPST